MKPEDQIKKAHNMVYRLCDGAKWIMSVPVDRERDPDMVITDGLMTGESAIRLLKQAYKTLDTNYTHFEGLGMDEAEDLRLLESIEAFLGIDRDAPENL